MSRIVAAPTIAQRHLRALAVEVEVVPEVDGHPIAPEEAAVVMAYPDVLGRMVEPPRGHRILALVDRLVGDTVEVAPHHHRVDVGGRCGDPGALIAALGDLRKRLTTAGGTRSVCDAPYAIPLIAHGGIGPIPDWCVQERPHVPGLAGLVVVRPIASPRWRGRRSVPPRVAVV